MSLPDDYCPRLQRGATGASSAAAPPRRCGMLLPLLFLLLVALVIDPAAAGYREILEAQQGDRLAEVESLAAEMIAALGSSAGLPESPDRTVQAPAAGAPLVRDEIDRALGSIRARIETDLWWWIGLDASGLDHKPREVASSIVGLLAAVRCGAADPERCLALARDAGDWLVWAQQQGGKGVFPFPACRTCSGKVFEQNADKLEQAEREGRLAEIVRNGWIVEDRSFEEGGLQFDNGLCGVALCDLYLATGDERYRAAARAAADWAVGRHCVPNWNYNSFSVHLLVRVWRITSERKYLEAAKRKMEIGMLPGQLTSGERAGRWADPHNAMASYHFILTRALVDLFGALDDEDPLLPRMTAALRLALTARRDDFDQGLIPTINDAIEVHVLVAELAPARRRLLGGDTGHGQAFAVLSRFLDERWRAGALPADPGAWGRYLVRMRGGARTFEEWVSQADVSDAQRQPLSTPAGDGVANLVKFALGAPPAEPAGARLPVPGLVAQSGQAPAVSLVFARNIWARDLRTALEVSTDLVTWTEVASTTDILAPVVEGNQPVRLREASPAAGGAAASCGSGSICPGRTRRGCARGATAALPGLGMNASPGWEDSDTDSPAHPGSVVQAPAGQVLQRSCDEDQPQSRTTLRQRPAAGQGRGGAEPGRAPPLPVCVVSRWMILVAGLNRPGYLGPKSRDGSKGPTPDSHRP